MPSPPAFPLLPRNAVTATRVALEAGRVVLVAGPRQSGKTTLAREVCRARGGEFASLDTDATLRTALADPTAFVERESLLAIDEFQRAGEPLLRAIKASVDRDPRKGRFLLTGSTRFLTVPNLSESLAGRVILVDLWPLSQGEIRSRREDYAAHLFGDTAALRRSRVEPLDRAEYLDAVCRGGFPEIHAAADPLRRPWYSSYLRTIAQRDATEVSRIRRAGDLPTVMKVIAARTAQELNVSEVARDLHLPRTTVEDYGLLLENLYLWFRLPAWSRNLTTRAVRHPKAYVCDSGLAAHLLGTSAAALAVPGDPALGPLVETFVAGEILRQRTWSEIEHEPFHFRDAKGAEVDLVLEGPAGRVAGIEVKASSTFDDRSLRSLALLRDRLGSRFANGVVLYLGKEVLPAGDRLTAMPLSALWAT